SDKRARTRRSSDATASTAARTPTMPAPKPASPSPPTHQPAPRPHSRARTGAKQTPVTPLRIISLFLEHSETVVGIGAMKTSGTLQWLVVIFAMLLPTMVAVAFFWVLRDRAFAFYHPAEYGDTNPTEFIEAHLGASKLVRSTADVTEKIAKFGNPDHFQLLFKVQAESEKTGA